jgi:hypothetical protein
MLQVFLSRCCICFTYMLQEFHLDVAYVFQWLHTCFSSVSDVCCKCSNCFRPMLHVFHLNVAIVDLVLHMLQWDPSVIAAYMRGCGGDASDRHKKWCGCKSRCDTHVGAHKHGKQRGTGPHLKQAQACGARVVAWLCGGAGRRSRPEHPVTSPPSGCTGTRPTEILRACMDTYLFISIHMS